MLNTLPKSLPRRQAGSSYGKLPSWPTDRQAEVLYPHEVPTRYLRRIDVQREEAVDTLHGILAALGLKVPVCHAPEVFQ